MLFGTEPNSLAFVHVVISLVAIAVGLIVLGGMLASQRLSKLTAVFLSTTVATSVTGFLFFPFERLLPSHVTGILSLVVLAVAIYALYAKRLAGKWRWIYVTTAVASLYLNVFVLVVQLFLKVPDLKALAPTQSEPPFAVAQLIVLLLFVIAGIIAAVRFRPRLSGGV